MRVLVVGGGPAGSTLALRLARAGVAVQILERSRFPRDKVCGGFINPLGVRCLAEIGLLDQVLSAGARWISSASMVLPYGDPIAVSFGRREAGRKPLAALSLPRRVLDMICLDAAGDEGAEITQGFRVTGVERTPDGAGWRVTGIDAGAEARSVAADMLVGADGVASVVVRRMGWLRRAWPARMGITASYRDLAVEPEVIEMHLRPEAYCGIVGQAGGLTHVGLAFLFQPGGWPARLSPARAPDDPLAQVLDDHLVQVLDDHLARFPGIARRLGSAHHIGRVRAFGPMSARSDRCVADRLLLVGDAAGFLDPATGHGIGFALRSAALAAEVIIGAARSGDLSSRALYAYGEAYRRDLGPILRYYACLQRCLSLPPALLMAAGRFLSAHPSIIEWIVRRSITDEPTLPYPLLAYPYGA